MRKVGTNKNCAHCGTAFYVPGWSSAKYCSMKCRRADQPPKVSATCEGCGKAYVVRAYRGETTRYCSRVCRTLPLSTEERKAIKRAKGRDYYERNKLKWGRYLDENREHIYTENHRRRRENPKRTTEWNRRNREKNGDKLRAGRREHYRKNKPIYVANARKREERIRIATPSWADLKVIEQFYINADKLTQLTGIKFHVDHIYPLRGKNMCGLHVETNLQVIPAYINLRKSNFIIDDHQPRCNAWPSMLSGDMVIA